MPRRLVQKFLAPAGASLKSLLTLISQLETQDAPAAEGLRGLAHHYDYEAILRAFPGDPA
jgi:hypothetical protein